MSKTEPNKEPSTLWAAQQELSEVKQLLNAFVTELIAYTALLIKYRELDRKRSKAARRVAKHARYLREVCKVWSQQAKREQVEIHNLGAERDRLIENWPHEKWCNVGQWVHNITLNEWYIAGCTCAPQQRARRIAKGEHESGK